MNEPLTALRRVRGILTLACGARGHNAPPTALSAYSGGMDMDLNGKVAIITGASSGIGAATARALRAAGANLVLTARREDRIEALAKEIGGAIAVAGDITDSDMPCHLIDRALDTYGRCDVVVNNAGFMDAATVDDMDIERACAMVRVNVEAAYRMAYTAAKHFKAKKSGHLVNISSILGTKVRPTAGAYAGTKHAIEALSEALRIELGGTGVKVSVIEPGLTLTELHNHWKVHPKDAMNINPLAPEDIARAIRFVLEQPAHVLVPKIMMIPADQQL